MKTQRRTIMGACEYAIASLQNLKKGLMYSDDKNMEIKWAIGGIVATLSSNLIQIADDVFQEAAQSGEPNARTDILEIQNRFNQFIDRMLSNAS